MTSQAGKLVRFAMLSNKPAEVAYEAMLLRWDSEAPPYAELGLEPREAWRAVIEAALEVVAKEVGG